jgi:beta-lactam-binding protein with PASTA domain
MTSGKAVVLALLTGVAASAGTFFALKAATGGKRVEMAEVPTLSGLSLDQARQLLEAKDLRLAIFERRPDAKIARDKIARQVPLPRSQLARQSPVYVIVSTGRVGTAAAARAPAKTPAVRTPAVAKTPAVKTPAVKTPAVVKPSGAKVVVPKLYYKRPAQARRLLEGLGLKVGRRRTIADEDKASGLILRQRPRAGKEVERGTAVDYWINDTDY